MFKSNKWSTGFEINDIEICNFDSLKRMSNDDVLKLSRGDVDKRLGRFLSQNMGIEHRYFVPENLNAFDLGKVALERLLEKDPELKDSAEFLIYGGISNPLPTVCHAALLSNELELNNTSCWDLKSGCSTGVLALVQALEWFEKGAKKGIIVCSETFSKFTDPETLQMTGSIGDGAVAFSLSRSDEWLAKGVVHGTDARYFKTMYVPGKYPVLIDHYNPKDYVFKFEGKSEVLEMTAHYWKQSLHDVLEVSGVEGKEITHYIAHQVDGKKNKSFAMNEGIPENAIALNFKDYGNMGCPTIFINYFKNINMMEFKKDNKIIFHAVGGGLSWASICLEKIK